MTMYNAPQRFQKIKAKVVLSEKFSNLKKLRIKYIKH
jgi:hypothetical protein